MCRAPITSAPGQNRFWPFGHILWMFTRRPARYMGMRSSPAGTFHLPVIWVSVETLRPRYSWMSLSNR